MSIPNPNVNKGGTYGATPILRSQIEEAQRNSNSAAGAARYLGVSEKRYKKYAQLYGIYEQHLNPTGIGIDKGWGKKPTSTPLRDILAGKHPNYSLARLKNRLIARKKLIAQCTLCGFNEQRITDGLVPLMLSFKDGNRKNFSLDNLELLCYNCMFLTTGAPSIVNKRHIKRSFTHPEKVPKKHSLPPSPRDSYDPTDTPLPEELDITLTDDERRALLEE